ncbi:MAG: flavodoxin domain-containing protein [Bacteroidales bacterium]|nr:flavodoxin domain-containing protein [Bacteroidales bacterium]HQL70091.1 flavodoxin domain-containing protein [Bacteroidales bacterium]
MNTIIVYVSHHGTTEKAAKMLQQELGSGVEVVNLRENKKPDLALYDTVIVGGSIHAGSIQGRVKKFCLSNHDILLQKRTGYFICCMERSEKQTQQLEAAYPETLRAKATALGMFGGEFIFDRMNFLEKAIIKKISGLDKSVSDINEAAIKEFAQKIKA